VETNVGGRAAAGRLGAGLAATMLLAAGGVLGALPATAAAPAPTTTSSSTSSSPASSSLAVTAGTLLPGVPVTATSVGSGQPVRLTIPARPATAVPPIITISGYSASGSQADYSNYTRVTVEQGGKEIRLVAEMYPSMTSWTDQLNTGGIGSIDLTRPAELVFRPALQDSVVTTTVELTQPKGTTVAVPTGRPVTVNLPGPGDHVRLTFTTGPRQRLLVRLTSDTTGGAAVDLDPKGWGTESGGNTADGSGYVAFPAGGPARHSLVVHARENATGSVRVTLIPITDPEYRAGTGETLVRWGFGEHPRLTFRGTAGTRAGIMVSAPGGAAWGSLSAALFDARGVQVSYAPVSVPSSGGLLDFSEVLPATGDYIVDLDAGYTTGSITATVLTVRDLTLAATPGQPLHVALDTPGQKAYVTFPMHTGEVVHYAVHGSTIPSTGLQLWWGDSAAGLPVDRVVVDAGDHAGTIGDWWTMSNATYTVIVDPVGASTGAMDLTLGPN
jgi:hypothetical protein